MTRDELPAVLNTELRALFARCDAIEAEAREVRRRADRRYNIAWWVTWALIGVSLLTRSTVPWWIAFAVSLSNFAWWWREDRRAQSIDARVRSLWPRVMPLCIALDHVAPRTRKPIPEAS